jgi:DNA-binding transcriptional LysR family regulator
MEFTKMQSIDLNLLVALDALLAERSVTRAAQRLNLSPPAMSRTLGRIREAFRDPILVRAGRGMVLTPRAETLRVGVRDLVASARGLLEQGRDFDLARLERTFTLRASDALVLAFGPRLVMLARGVAPGVRLRFVPEGEEDVEALRDGRVDLDIGVIGETGPEIRVQKLFRDRYVGLVRKGHVLCEGEVTPERYAAQTHVAMSRRGVAKGPIDKGLEERGLARFVAVVVSTMPEAVSLAMNSDLVASVPERLAQAAQLDAFAFPLPVRTEDITIAHAWHPRFEADQAHSWLRGCVRQAFGEAG